MRRAGIGGPPRSSREAEMAGDELLLELAQWRARTAELYAAVRGAPESGAAAACREFRRRRDEMFASHPQSPLDEKQKKAFRGLSWFPYDPALRLRVAVHPVEEAQAASGPGAGVPLFELPEGPMRVHRFAQAVIGAPGSALDGAALTLYWVEGYGGGLFLPFKDLTNGGKPTAAAATCTTRSRAPTSARATARWSLISTTRTTPPAPTTRAGSARSRRGKMR